MSAVAGLTGAMAPATSALVAGQAPAVAGTGRLAESYGPAAAFGWEPSPRRSPV